MVTVNTNKAEIKQDLALLCADMGPAETRSLLCPFCQADWEAQGRPASWSPAKSLSVTREPAGYLYHCFRASCRHGNPGGLVADKPYQKGLTPKKKFIPKFYKGLTETLPAKVYADMVGRYDVDRQVVDSLHWKWAPAHDRLYVPVTNSVGYIIGEWLKTFIGSKPKTLLNKHNDVPMVYYPYTNHKQKSIVVVEDPISAVKVGSIKYTCAILGTGINDAMVDQWLAEGIKHIVLFLDGDAAVNALRLAKKYSGLLSISVKLLPYGMDPKDLLYSEIEELLT